MVLCIQVSRHLINFNQCAIPAFDRLLDDKNNEIVLDLLFELGTWHALAKLRLHTESTVSELEYSTTRLGSALRKFARSTCEDFITVDLPSEEAARGRRKAARATRVSSRPTTQKGKEKAKGPKTRKFNLKTYKMHALGDYAKCIRLFGTSDGYSTQTVCASLQYIGYDLCLDRVNLNIDGASAFTLGFTKARNITGEELQSMSSVSTQSITWGKS